LQINEVPPMRNLPVVLAALLALTACSTSPRMTSAERLELYRTHAGDPVRSVSVPTRLWGWRSLGDDTLAIWTRSDRGYLVELVNRCPEMPFAKKIGLTNRNGRVWAGFDSVIVQRSGRPTDPTLCRIRTMRPIEPSAVSESRRDLEEVDLVDGGAPPDGEAQ
jgi:hypothetical protein